MSQVVNHPYVGKAYTHYLILLRLLQADTVLSKFCSLSIGILGIYNWKEIF